MGIVGDGEVRGATNTMLTLSTTNSRPTRPATSQTNNTTDAINRRPTSTRPAARSTRSKASCARSPRPARSCPCTRPRRALSASAGAAAGTWRSSTSRARSTSRRAVGVQMASRWWCSCDVWGRAAVLLESVLVLFGGSPGRGCDRGDADRTRRRSLAALCKP